MTDERVPGEQSWSRNEERTVNGSQSTKGHLPKEVFGKYPIPDKEGKYLGALVKVSTSTINWILTDYGRYMTRALPSSQLRSIPSLVSCPQHPFPRLSSRVTRTRKSWYLQFTSSRSSKTPLPHLLPTTTSAGRPRPSTTSPQRSIPQIA